MTCRERPGATSSSSNCSTTNCIRPWCVNVEQEFSAKLVSSLERAHQYIEQVSEGFLRGDIAQRGAYYVQAVSNGWMTINEIRSRENLPPIPGGDSARVPMNTQALAPSAEPDPVDETQGHKAAMIAAHRALLVDVLGRIIRRFVEKAKRATATPQKLRVCADTFFTDEHHITLSVGQLEPALRAWLTYIDSSVTPSVAGDAIARQLNVTYHRQITALLDGCVVADPEYHNALTAMLYRLERYGADEIADSILRHGIGADGPLTIVPPTRAVSHTLPIEGATESRIAWLQKVNRNAAAR